MAFEIDPDLFRSAAHRNMAAHLTAPLQTGAVDSALELDAGSRIVLNGSLREPLLLVAPRRHLDRTGIRVRATLDPGGAATPMLDLEFVPYTEAGSFLPLYRPPVDLLTRSADGFTIELALEFFDEDGAAAPAPADASPAAHLEVRLFQGTLGALIYMAGFEKARIRRQAREIAAMRHLSRARRDALDRFGADLAVPRFSDRIEFNAERNEIVTVHQDAAGRLLREPDADYQRRLRLHHPWLMPTPRHALQMLNGPGAAGDNNAGPIGELGLAQRFNLEQRNNELAFAVHISSTSPEHTANLLKFIRDVYLIWPAASPAADAIHAARPMAAAMRARLDTVRKAVRDSFDFGADMAIAPQMSDHLARIAACRTALGIAGKIPVKRAQDGAAGSRYQLGLGIDIEPPAAADLDAMHAALGDPNRAAAQDPQLEGLLRSLKSRPAAADPEGAWLFEACGLRTVHRVNANTIYLSHLPTFGLVVNRVGAPDPRGAGAFEARYHAPGDPGANVVLVSAAAAAAAAWNAQGGEAFDVLSTADARAEWDAPVAVTAGAQTIFKAAGLPGIAENAGAVAALKNLPEELIETVRLGPALSQQIIDGDPAATQPLRDLTGHFRDAGVASVLPLMVAGNRVHLVLGVISLPEAGVNLSDRRASGFRWYVVPIEGPGGSIKSIGSRTVYAPTGPGINAIVAVGYARRGFADPYEFRVELPEDARLNLLQYEYLMNLLDRVYPIGVEVNTFSIRQRHVDLNGDGAPEPLSPSIFRTYRKYRRSRQRGEAAVGLSQSQEQ